MQSLSLKLTSHGIFHYLWLADVSKSYSIDHVNNYLFLIFCPLLSGGNKKVRYT